MKKIIVIGNSIAGVKALETIRGFDAESDLTIFALDGFYPYNRELFVDYFLKKIKESKLSYKPKEFYEQNRINVILQRQISRINFKNKRIFTPEKDQIDFDILIIADTHQVKFPDIKGTSKTGVFALRKLSDLKKIIAALPFVETIVIETNSPQGFRMADAFKKAGKEVIVVLPSPIINFRHSEEHSDEESHPKEILRFAQNDEKALFPNTLVITQKLEQTGIQVILDSSIAEILGEAEVKAIRLKSGKVLAAEMLVFTDTPPDLRLFNDTGLEMGEKIWVDSSFKTNLEGVFALDHAAQLKEESLNQFDPTAMSYLEEAGKTAASNIAGLNKMNVLTILSKDDANWADKALKAEKAGYVGRKESSNFLSKFPVENRKYM
ncbi:MAG TPA: FAD-dependent oxidoreductase [Candidatus Omnitrophota bacterium]|nr:FAD-dependent oxidoreductase [Candidatus Omnitrophota bacterium]